MTEALEKAEARTDDEHFRLDGEYLKTQATEAVFLFLAPISGVITAAAGAAIRGPLRARRKRTKKRAA